MASYPTPPYFLWSQRPRSLSTFSSNLATSSVLLILATLSRASSSRPPLPPSLARIPPSPSRRSPNTCSVSSQLSARRGRPVLLRLPVRPPPSVSLPYGLVPLGASSLPLLPPTSAPTAILPVVTLLEPEKATTLIVSITLVVQPLSSASVESFIRVVIVNDLPLAPNLHDWDWPPGWVSRLGERY